MVETTYLVEYLGILAVTIVLLGIYYFSIIMRPSKRSFFAFFQRLKPFEVGVFQQVSAILLGILGMKVAFPFWRSLFPEVDIWELMAFLFGGSLFFSYLFILFVTQRIVKKYDKSKTKRQHQY